MGLVPPRVVVGLEADLSVCERRSANVTRELLNPKVFRFAMLFAITSSLICWLRKPDIALKNARPVMGSPPMDSYSDPPDGWAIL
jgi:hypothetical protein